MNNALTTLTAHNGIFSRFFWVTALISILLLPISSHSRTDLPLRDLRIFTEAFTKIKQDYVEDTSDKKLLEDAIQGMLSGLDPHSSYLNAEDYKSLKQGTTGEFGGLGIEVGLEDGFVKVISPIDDTPAKKAGVKAGDLIIRLDETPVKGLSLREAVEIMRGKPGTKIELTIVRDGESKPIKIVIKRAVIRVTSVKSRLLEDGYGYVRITQFQNRTSKGLRKELDSLKKENKGNLKGLILDLRNNPGGVLSAAVSVSDTFINDGLIVYTDGRQTNSRLNFTAKKGDALNGAPIVVLVNGGSASASEIVAGALQDKKRAIIMGDRTFGKGSVQTILPMNNGGAIKLTTALYYTPSGRSIQATGIEPDIFATGLTVAKADPSFGSNRISEQDLRGRLDNAEKSKDESGSKKSDEDSDKENGEINLASEDFVLYEALNLLKGLDILSKK